MFLYLNFKIKEKDSSHGTLTLNCISALEAPKNELRVISYRY